MFLNLAQAAETFHARIRERAKLLKEEYEKKKEEYDSIKNEILKVHVDNKEHYGWLKKNLSYYLTFSMRLKEIVDFYSCDVLDKIIGDKDTFIEQVVISRNYYTHYSSNLKERALNGSDLFHLAPKLKIVLVCTFLLEAGFDKDKLNKLLDKHRVANFLTNL